MADSENPTVPPPTWSFDHSSPRPEDTSAESTLRDSANPTKPGPTWSFDGVPTHSKDTSPESPPLLPADTPSTSDSDAAPAAAPDAEYAQSEHSEAENTEAADAPPEHPDPRRYKTRTCRICFDEVLPTFEPVNPTAQFLRQRPRVVYISDDPDCGRLMRPCKCKGTQKYVHEGCLKAWRMAAGGADRNLWKCPTCLYEYRLNRLSWGAWVSSKMVRAGLTLLIMLLSVFLLGFIADPILRYANPAAMLSDYSIGVFDEFEDLEDWIPEQPNTWSWHFTRGFFALGFMGMFKTVFLYRPWHFVRVGAGAGARRRGGGRERLENISWVMVLVGVAVFLRVSCFHAANNT